MNSIIQKSLNHFYVVGGYYTTDNIYISGGSWYNTFENNIKNEIFELDNYFFNNNRYTFNSLSGVCFNSVNSLNDIYKIDNLTGNGIATTFFYSDNNLILHNYQNSRFVDYAIDYNIDISSKIYSLNDGSTDIMLKNGMRFLLFNQTDIRLNGVYYLNNNSLILDVDLITTENSYKYKTCCVYGKYINVVFYLNNKLNNTFPTNTENKSFSIGDSYMIKSSIYYDYTKDIYPNKMLFTDYSLAKNLVADNNLYYSAITIDNFSSITYLDFELPYDVSFRIYRSVYNGLDYSISNIMYYSGSCFIELYGGDESNVFINDEIKFWYGVNTKSLIKTSVKNKIGNIIELYDIIPNHVNYDLFRDDDGGLMALTRCNYTESLINQYFDIELISNTLTITPKFEQLYYCDITVIDDLLNTYKFNTNNSFSNYNIYDVLDLIDNNIFNTTYQINNKSNTTNTYFIISSDNQTITLSAISNNIFDLYSFVDLGNYFGIIYNVSGKIYKIMKIGNTNTTPISKFETVYNLETTSNLLNMLYYNKSKNVSNIKDNVCEYYGNLLLADKNIQEVCSGLIYNKNQCLMFNLFENFEVDSRLKLQPMELYKISMDKKASTPLYLKIDSVDSTYDSFYKNINNLNDVQFLGSSSYTNDVIYDEQNNQFILSITTNGNIIYDGFTYKCGNGVDDRLSVLIFLDLECNVKNVLGFNPTTSTNNPTTISTNNGFSSNITKISLNNNLLLITGLFNGNVSFKNKSINYGNLVIGAANNKQNCFIILLDLNNLTIKNNILKQITFYGSSTNIVHSIVSNLNDNTISISMSITGRFYTFSGVAQYLEGISSYISITDYMFIEKNSYLLTTEYKDYFAFNSIINDIIYSYSNNSVLFSGLFYDNIILYDIINNVVLCNIPISTSSQNNGLILAFTYNSLTNRYNSLTNRYIYKNSLIINNTYNSSVLYNDNYRYNGIEIMKMFIYNSKLYFNIFCKNNEGYCINNLTISLDEADQDSSTVLLFSMDLYEFINTILSEGREVDYKITQELFLQLSGYNGSERIEYMKENLPSKIPTVNLYNFKIINGKIYINGDNQIGIDNTYIQTNISTNTNVYNGLNISYNLNDRKLINNIWYSENNSKIVNSFIVDDSIYEFGDLAGNLRYKGLEIVNDKQTFLITKTKNKL